LKLIQKISFSVKTTEKTAVEGRRVSLPCPLTTPSREKAYMVLWFKNDVKIPIYR
jgi:dual oxidase maturation factor 1